MLLFQRRNEILKDFNEELVTYPIVESNTVIRSRKALCQIIDTTLLKCYVNTNDAFLAPLLRLKDNSCHLDESERVLKKHQKHEELIILYNKRGHHRKGNSGHNQKCFAAFLYLDIFQQTILYNCFLVESKVVRLINRD